MKTKGKEVSDSVDVLKGKAGTLIKQAKQDPNKFAEDSKKAALEGNKTDCIDSEEEYVSYILTWNPDFKSCNMISCKVSMFRFENLPA